MGVEALVALGGNLGAVSEAFASARKLLRETPGLAMQDSSALYHSPPLGVPGQPDYLNAVMALETEIGPEELLLRLQSIESRHGRTRGPERWGPRTLDLDLIAYDDTVMQTAQLVLPHPCMHERMFVLQPLCDIRPAWRHPVLKSTAREMLDTLVARGIPLLEDGRAW